MPYLYVITFLSPLLGVFHAIKDFNWHQKIPILTIVIGLFGGTIILQTSDGYVLQQMIYDHYVNLTFDQWFYELKEMLMFSPEIGTKGDVFSHVASYVVGELLGCPGQYFLFVSLVYGFFYIKALSLILHWDSSTPKSNLFWMLIIIFITYRFVDNLQTVRTWTGLWVLFNGVYGYHQTRKLKYLLLIIAAPLFHIAYFIIAIPAILAMLGRWINRTIIIGVYALSFFVQVNASNIVQLLQTTELGQEKVASYYREDPNEYRDPLNEKSANWYKIYGKGWALPNAPHFLGISLISFGLFSKRKMTCLEFGLFSTGLLMAAIANFGDFIPAFYNRTMINAGIYITATAVLLLLRNQMLNVKGWKLYIRKILLWVSSVTFVPYIVYVGANMLQFTSVFMLSFPLLGFFPEANISIRQFIGSIF